MALHRTFEPNLHGRDFFVGDVHGHLDVLEYHMRRVLFNSSHDRLFLMGDLADRGPFSQETLELLNEPYIFSSLGNHEFMLLQVIAFIASLVQKGEFDLWMESPDKWKDLGYMGKKDARWLQGLIEEKDFDTLWGLSRLIQQQCFLIGTVYHPNGRFAHFTHSALPMPTEWFIHSKEQPLAIFRQDVSDIVFDFSLGSRFMSYKEFGHHEEKYKNQGLTIVGHYGVDVVSYFDHHIFMDIGLAQQDLALHTLDELFALEAKGLV